MSWYNVSGLFCPCPGKGKGCSHGDKGAVSPPSFGAADVPIGHWEWEPGCCILPAGSAQLWQVPWKQPPCFLRLLSPILKLPTAQIWWLVMSLCWGEVPPTLTPTLDLLHGVRSSGPAPWCKREVCDGPELRPSKLISHKGHQSPRRCQELLTPCGPGPASGACSPCPETARSHWGSARIHSWNWIKPELALT